MTTRVVTASAPARPPAYSALSPPFERGGKGRQDDMKQTPCQEGEETRNKEGMGKQRAPTVRKRSTYHEGGRDNNGGATF